MQTIEAKSTAQGLAEVIDPHAPTESPDTLDAERIGAATAKVSAASARVTAAREHTARRERELRGPEAEYTVAVAELQLAQQRYDDAPTEAGLVSLEAARAKRNASEAPFRDAERALETARTVLSDCERALSRATDDKRRAELRPRLSEDALYQRTRARMVEAVALLARVDVIRRELLRETDTFMAERDEAKALGLELPAWATNPQATDEILALAAAHMRDRDRHNALPPLVLSYEMQSALDRRWWALAHAVMADGLESAAKARG